MTAYIRDIFNLPLYGVRILLINAYLLSIGLLFYTYTKNQRHVANITLRKLSRIPCFVVFITIILLTVFVFLILNILNQGEDYFFAVQILNFVFAFFYLNLIIKGDGLISFLKSLSISLWLVLIFQVLLKIIGATMGLSGELLSNRNSLPYIALLFYLLYRSCSLDKRKQNFILVVLLALINQTNGVFLLLLCCFIHLLFTKTLLRVALFKRVYIPIIISVMLLGSYFGIHLLLLYTGISAVEFKLMQHSRHEIIDNIASIISRAGSVSFTLESWFKSGQLLGFGPSKASKLLYWGYPTHNYFAAVIAITGVLGIFFSLSILVILYKVFTINIFVGVVGLFFLSVSNDLSLIVLLTFIPLIMNKLNLYQQLKLRMGKAF